MYKILVIGSKGQLGSEIQTMMKKFSRLEGVYHDADTLDITQIEMLESLFEQKKFDAVVNCAAYTAVDKAESDSEMAYLINAQGVSNIASVCKKHDVKFIHVSTDYVFDGNSYVPYKEDDKVCPQSVYGKSKLEGEQMAATNPQTIIIRTSWLYSSHGHNFVKTMLNLGKQHKSINVIFDQVGTPTYARDLAKAICEILDKTLTNTYNFVSGVYHFSNEGVCSWYDFAWEIMHLSKTNCKVMPIETKDFPSVTKRPLFSVLNKAKIKSTYEIEIPNWKESLVDCLKQI
jgi:dTDP-4-dehydrorhamnose reductase